jgi:protein-tyrosine-phosphatase
MTSPIEPGTDARTADTSAKVDDSDTDETGPRSMPALLMPEAVLTRSAQELASRFAGVFSPETVERYVFESYTALRRTAKVTHHLPSLARGFATERLTALAQSKGAIVKDVPEVLFVCVHNAGRSQMAAALLTHHAAGRVHVRSAGSAPVETITPVVVEAMAEIGLDLGQEFPKPLTDDVVAAADWVVSMGCGDACPIYPGKRYLDWTLKDPHQQSLPTVRAIRDELDRLVQDLLAEITTPAQSRT